MESQRKKVFFVLFLFNIHHLFIKIDIYFVLILLGGVLLKEA